MLDHKTLLEPARRHLVGGSQRPEALDQPAAGPASFALTESPTRAPPDTRSRGTSDTRERPSRPALTVPDELINASTELDGDRTSHPAPAGADTRDKR